MNSGGRKAVDLLAGKAPYSAFLIALVILLWQLAPDIGGGDSGELVVAAARKGVPHPPGYPLYVLLGHAFAALPWGGIAARINALSAVCQAGAVGLLVSATQRGLGATWPGLVAGALFACLPATLLYGIHAEVFALNNLMTAALAWFVARFVLAPSPRVVWLAALVGGLGLGNHHTLAFIGMGLVIWAATTQRARLEKRMLVLGTLAFVMGLGIYGVLPSLGDHPSLSDWGDVTQWDGFWTHVLRREYGTFRLSVQGAETHSESLARWGVYAERTFRELGGLGFVAALLGMVGIAWHRAWPAWVGFVCIAYVVSLGAFMALDTLSVEVPLQIGIQERFWMAPNMLLCVLAAYGCQQIVQALQMERRTWIPALMVSCACALGALHVHGLQPQRLAIHRAFGEAMLLAAPKDALIVTRGEKIYNPLHHLQEDEHLRPDVQTVDATLMQTPWYGRLVRAAAPGVAFPGPRRAVPGVADGFTLQAFVRANLSTRPVLLCNDLATPDAELREAFDTQPYGFCMRLWDKGEGDDAWMAASRAALARMQPFESMHADRTTWEYDTQRSMLIAQRLFAGRLLNVAASQQDNAALLDEALRLLQSVRAREPEPEPSTYRNLGIAFQALQGRDTQARERMREAWARYLQIAPADDPALEQIRVAVGMPE